MATLPILDMSSNMILRNRLLQMLVTLVQGAIRTMLVGCLSDEIKVK